MAATPLPELVEGLVRRRYAAMVARLVRMLGPSRFDLAEDVVQEALVRALRAWPARGIPDDPEAWLFRAAKNLALDGLRRRSLGARVEGELARWAHERERAEHHPSGAVGVEPGGFDEGQAVADDTLRMMFLGAHPGLSEDARVPFVLKTVCGFGNAAIASALLAKEGTIAQRLTRAKARLAGEGARFEMPPPDRLGERLETVLTVLYLLFNEGYRAHRGEDLVRVDLVHEALRLTQLLTEHAATDRPAVHALLALMLLLGARLPARTDALGEVLTLAEQDRGLWERTWIAAGFEHLRRSIGGEHLGPYHVEAAIASLHAAAPRYEETDWRAILAEYDRLLSLRDEPVARLNRVVAVAKVHGPRSALSELDELPADGPLSGYSLRLATRAQLHWALGETEQATRALAAALELPCSEPERRLLRRRLESCRAGAPPPRW